MNLVGHHPNTKMMKITYPLLIVSIVLVMVGCGDRPKTVQPPSAFDHAATQTRIMLGELERLKPATGDPKPFPRTLTKYGELHKVGRKDWTSGFFPGTLWLLYENTGDDHWLAPAQHYTAQLEEQKNNPGSHDVGFQIGCSYGNGYRITGNGAYRDIIIQTAKTLITRFNPLVGAIRSWDHNTDKWEYPVIIDNMMNLELLFAASRLSGDSTYYEVAVQHANTTLKNHFREDFSSFHVVGFDPKTGEVVTRGTHQGHSDASAWARGQAWALYGYTMAHRETGDRAYLELAEHVAGFLLEHPRMPEDLVPYWDFDVPDLEKEPRDVSAAAIMASALYELGTYSQKEIRYREAADKILASLFKKYKSPVGGNKGFILQHSTGHKPRNSEVDVPLNYADYYYLEALSRRKQLNETGKLEFLSGINP